MCQVPLRALTSTAPLLFSTPQAKYYNYHYPPFIDGETQAQKRLGKLSPVLHLEMSSASTQSQGNRASVSVFLIPTHTPPHAEQASHHSGTVWNSLTLLLSPEEIVSISKSHH